MAIALSLGNQLYPHLVVMWMSSRAGRTWFSIGYTYLICAALSGLRGGV